MRYILGICLLLLATLPVYAFMGDEVTGGFMDDMNCGDKTQVDRGVNAQEVVNTVVPATAREQRRQRQGYGSQDSVQ